ncbi:hypothetical protein BFW38_15315 [Terasakiispira papahanaumokuakeensis]|uniref:Uncharacterized protein n=2 Tax=Terasakiispira papahanaumokuakeensis TaxID=197479 RepID=A0A1E2VCL2_9GAMM|nr:hypothetical protein BFW38_15315 [Terasakiispira papahanaumokuakeensis]
MMTQPKDTANDTRSRLLNFFTLVTLGTILVSVWYLTDYYWLKDREQIRWVHLSNCDLPRSTCVADLGQGRQVSLQVLAPTIRPLQPMPVLVTTSGFRPDRIALDLQGVDMYMGYNRTELVQVSPGHYTGEPRLSLCTEQKMPWRAGVILYGNEGPIGVQFDFLVSQRHQK